MTEEIRIPHFICLRCRHTWMPRKEEKPRVCPACKSPYWDRPRKKKAAKR